MTTACRLIAHPAVLVALVVGTSVGAIQVGAMNGTAVGAMAGAQVVVSSSGASMTTTVTEMIGPGVSGGTKPMEIGTGVVMGRVVEADGTSPVAGTIVTLSLPGFAPQRVLTDGQGRFAYRGLPKGSFSLTASRPGFVDGAHGRLRPGGTPMAVEITETLRTGTADIMVWRHAAIAGTVLDENNEPLVGAPVRALRRDYTSGRRRLTDSGFDTTDDRGQFRMGSLEPGEYVVVLPFTQRPSLDSMMRGMREAERSMSSGASGTFSVAAVRVEGAPLSGGGGGGNMTFMTTSDGGVPPAGTDADGQPLTYQTEFYTGALSASRAVAITVQPGEERTAVDFTLTPVRALSITGMVVGPDGPAANTQLQLIPADAEDLVSPIEAATATTDANGQFEFTGVPAGQYVLRAQRTPRFVGGAGERISFTSLGGEQVRMITQELVAARPAGAAPLPAEPTLWAEVPVGVGTRALAGMTVSLREGLSVSGNVVFQGGTAQPTAEARGGISITLEPADGRTAGMVGNARGRVDETGSFKTMGVPAGKYILRVSNAPQGWTLRSATFGGRDITETAVELKDESAGGVLLSFTDRPSEMTGTVRDASGNPDATASVIVFPVDPTGWVDTGSQPRRIKTSRTGKDGTFKIGPLPPGEYHVVAIGGSAPRTWQDPAYLDTVSRSATQIRIGDADARAVTLTSVKGPS